MSFHKSDDCRYMGLFLDPLSILFHYVCFCATVTLFLSGVVMFPVSSLPLNCFNYLGGLPNGDCIGCVDCLCYCDHFYYKFYQYINSGCLPTYSLFISFLKFSSSQKSFTSLATFINISFLSLLNPVNFSDFFFSMFFIGIYDVLNFVFFVSYYFAESIRYENFLVEYQGLVSVGHFPSFFPVCITSSLSLA